MILNNKPPPGFGEGKTGFSVLNMTTVPVVVKRQTYVQNGQWRDIGMIGFWGEQVRGFLGYIAG